MSVAAAINILLRGNTSDFEAKLKVVEKKFHSFLNVFEKGNFIGRNIAASFERAFSINGLKETFNEVVALGRVAERLEIPTEKLAGLQLAAEMSGESFEELTGAMQKMMLAVSGSGDPLKKAAADVAFNKLRISAESLKGLAADEMFKRIADALQNVGDVADRVNIAKSIFGKGGVGMLNVGKGGAKGLQQIQAAAEQAGIAVKGIQVEKFEKMKQTFELLSAQLKGISIIILGEIAPGLIAIGKISMAVVGAIVPFFERWAVWLKRIIELTVAYKAASLAVAAAQRAWAIAEAIKAAFIERSWNAILKVIAGVAAAGIATVAIHALFNEIEKLGDKIKDIELPNFDKLKDLDSPDFGKAISGPKHPGAFIKGSVEAYSAVLNAGGSPMSKIEANTKKSAMHLQNIEKAKAGPMIRPANIGGR